MLNFLAHSFHMECDFCSISAMQYLQISHHAAKIRKFLRQILKEILFLGFFYASWKVYTFEIIE